MLLGIAGTDGAGKGTVVEYLVAYKAFRHYSSRALIVEEIDRQEIEPTRANMRLVANSLREQHGNDFLVTQYLLKMHEEGVDNAIIESIRTLAEAETLKANGGILIAVDADQALRYARVQERRSETDKVSFEQFVAHEALEANDPNPHGMQKLKVIAMADYTILNNGTCTELAVAVEAVFRKINTI
jgi:dephospho-CoA kinase